MRKLYLLIFLLLAMACHRTYDEAPPYSQYVPVLMSRTELDKTIQKTDPWEINSPGKIYFKDPYVFITEENKGIHIIDNTSPANPQNIAFYTVQGCLDIVIKGNILYAQNLSDLVGMDIRDIQNPIIVSRTANLFPELYPEYSTYIPDEYRAENRPANTVIVEWKPRSR